jgi:hypothetical protein
MSKAFSLICLTVVMPASGRKKPKWSGSLAVGAGDRLAARRRSFGLEVSSRQVGGQDELGLRGRVRPVAERCRCKQRCWPDQRASNVHHKGRGPMLPSRSGGQAAAPACPEKPTSAHRTCRSASKTA